jgi:murein DD-endopeptidase MepM/ murein hydrolase activator NlpD
MNTFTHNLNLVGLVGTGAFFPAGDHELSLQPEEKPLWSQPWHMIPGEWTFEEITLTGDAAAIDAESIRQERERLAMIWNQSSELPLWHAAFEQPIQQYLTISSRFGARRSYNGGPYQSYHEGVDYSAYAGTPVYAPASGTVVLAEKLYVRGGAVIIDHGLGIYSGLYHLSEVLVEPEEQLSEGQIIGRVGTTGLSTGNHLHWDLLVGGTWVDASGWLDLNIACWILEGLEQTCDPA